MSGTKFRALSSVRSMEAVQETAPSFEAKAHIWRDYSAGLISFAEAQRRSAAIAVEKSEEFALEPTKERPARRKPTPRPRHQRPAPNPSRQYANPISTEAMRDDRLTAGAKALLVVLRARCGKGRFTDTCKTTLGAVISRSARTIGRYLSDLIRWGYVVVQTRLGPRGVHTGLVIEITDKVLPFFVEPKGLARWLGESALSRPFLPFAIEMGGIGSQTLENDTRTLLSYKNQSHKDSSYGKKLLRMGSSEFLSSG